jgi:tetratricopeptide (TPR) repeat protein
MSHFEIPRWKRVTFRLTAIGLSLFAVGALELSLRILRPGHLADGVEMKSNPAGMPLFRIKKKEGNLIYTPSRYFEPWGHHYQFVVPKPLGIYRIISLGSSTTNGGPFGNPGAFSRWLEVMLSAADDYRKYEVINLGQYGFPLSEIKELEKQSLAANPDLYIIYAGNNEFLYWRSQAHAWTFPGWTLWLNYWLEQTYTIKFWNSIFKIDSQAQGPSFGLDPGAMRAHAAYFFRHFLKRSQWDRQHVDWVRTQYHSNLEEMIAMAHQSGARVILCTVAVNLRDYVPYGSYHREGMSEAELKRWDMLMEQGKKEFAAGDFAAARNSFFTAVQLDPSAAESNFDLAHCLLKLGQSEESYPYFQAAALFNPARDQVGSDLNQIIREVARRHHLPLADIELQFRKKSREGVPGDDLFLDSVHPTLEGHQIIAQALLQVMIEQGWVKPGPGWESRSQKAVSAYEKQMPAEYLFNSYFTAASFNAFLGRFTRARHWLQQALAFSPHEASALQMNKSLDLLLSQSKMDPSLPWAEIELLKSYSLESARIGAPD